CEWCGKEAELRPYGPKGENVCFSCGMKDKTKCLFIDLDNLNKLPGSTPNIKETIEELKG
ncbi:hypothetical protein LCGC14_2382230, partial [marine sediment metagenome]